jgi:EpsD family peptidyl-prolyl cis-trans isomerase
MNSEMKRSFCPREYFYRSVQYVTFGIIVCFTLVGCGNGSDGKKDKAASQTAAKVNKEEITVHQINYVLQQQRALKPEMVASASMQVLERLVDQELELQKAQEQKVDRDPRVVQQIEFARREIISRAYIEKIGSGAPKPSQEEIKAYYESKPALFAQRKVYLFQEISIESPAESIEKLREELKAAKDISAFVEFLKANNYKFSARQYNRAAEQLPLAGLDAISQAKDGQALFSLTPDGAQVMVLAGSRSQPVDEARAQPAIEQFLLNERKRKLVEDDLKSLRAAAKIEYVGDYANGHAKTMDEKLKVTPSSSALVTAPSAASVADYMPPKPEPLASAPADIAPAESFTASSPSQRALESGLKGFK